MLADYLPRKFRLGLHVIDIPRAEIKSFCVRNHIRKLSLFGSILTDRFRPESDVDMLVEFEPGGGHSYFDLVGMEQELSATLGRKVDLRTPQELSRYFRDQVLAAAVVQYERE
jgi:predicted nucleotidyltransferase